MGEPHVISALTQKHRRVSFELRERQRDVKRLKRELWHLESAIRMFDAGYDMRSLIPKRTLFPVFRKRNEFFFAVMEIMRQAGVPLTADELTLMAFERRGMPNPEKRLFERYSRALHNRFKGMVKAGTVTAREEEWPWKWVVNASGCSVQECQPRAQAEGGKPTLS